MPLVQMQNIDAQNIVTPYYLSEQDAEYEWNSHADQAARYFLPTTAYQSFTHPSSLILLGRTGTGKTAIIRYFEHNIENKKDRNYAHTVRLYFQDILKCIPNFDVINASAKMFEEIVDALEIIINLRIMKKVYDGLKPRTDLKVKLEKYLREKRILNNSRNTVIHRIQKSINEAANLSGTAGEIATNLSVVQKVINAFCTETYDDLLLDMHNEIKSTPVLVLIDTMDRYDITDSRLVIVVKALISACFRFHNNSHENHTHVKLSLPSEIYTRIVQSLPGKQQGNTTIIQWSYKDLINLIALRLKGWRESHSNESELFSFIDRLNIDQFDSDTNDFELSKEMLYGFLPATCPTSLSFRLDTLAYIIRHTLKKPRELMLIFDAIIHRIISTGNIQYFIDNENDISKIVHSKQEELVMSALSMYETPYKDIGNYIQQLLANKNWRFSHISSEDAKRINAFLQARHLNYDVNDIMRVLVESGLLGKINKTGVIAANNNMLCNKNPITVLTAIFEYQIKGTLIFSSTDEYVIHPMCYEHFSCYIDDQTLVYPEKSDNDGDNVYMEIIEDTFM